VLHALDVGPRREELSSLLSMGAPDGRALERALEIVREGGGLERAREVVGDYVGRATMLSERLAPGPAQEALRGLAAFLAARCGADV
jgi:geranylgeranyl pyrophosphate synthase